MEGTLEGLETVEVAAPAEAGQVDESLVIVVCVAADSEGSLFPATADLDCRRHVAAFVAAGLDCRQIVAWAAVDLDRRHLEASADADLDCRRPVASLAADLGWQLVELAAADLDYRDFAAFVAAGLPDMNIAAAADGVAYKDHAGMASAAADACVDTEELVAAVRPAGSASAPAAAVAVAADRAPVVLAEVDTETAVAVPPVGAAAAAVQPDQTAAQKPRVQTPVLAHQACHTESRLSQGSSSREWRRRLALSRALAASGHQGRTAGRMYPRQAPRPPCPAADLITQ